MRGFTVFYQRAWIERYLYTSLYMKFDRVALVLLSLLYTFQNSTICDEISFDPDSFLEELKGLLIDFALLQNHFYQTFIAENDKKIEFIVHSHSKVNVWAHRIITTSVTDSFL